MGWLRADQLAGDEPLGAEDVDASSPLVHHQTTLRDALSMLLASAVQTAVVVDEHGRFAGVLTLGTISAAFRASPEASPASVA